MHDSWLIPCPSILPFSSNFQLSTFVPTVLCLFNNLSSKKCNYLSSLSLKCMKLLLCPMCSQASSLMGLTVHCLQTFVCLLCTWYILASFDGSLALLWSSWFPNPCCVCNSRFCRYLLYLPVAISSSELVSSGYSVSLL